MYNPQEHRPMQTIKIAKLILQETGTYNPMFSRPYQLHVDGAAMDSIVTRVEQANGAAITGSLFSGLTQNILNPSATPQAEIPIPLGWTERRIRFIMEAHVSTSMGSTFIYYFQGYTSHLGVTPNGAVDPRMEFIINSYVRVNRVTCQNAYGAYTRDVVTENCHVVNGNIFKQSQTGVAYMMRPQDIFIGAQSSYLQNAYSGRAGAGSFHDTRVGLNEAAVSSNRTNGLASSYIAKIVDSYQTTSAMSQFGQSSDDIYTGSAQLTSEAPLTDNVFLRALANVKGFGSVATFTLPELERLDTNVRNVTKYMTLGGTTANVVHNIGQSAYWNSTDNETLIATILSNAVPAVMMELMISNIHFRSTNYDIGSQMNTVLIDAKSLTNADLTQNFELFKKRIEREILLELTYSNQLSIMLEMKADLFGETMISISVSGAPPVIYTTPSFCDGLLAPVISNNSDSFNSLVHGFDQIINSLSGVNGNATAMNGVV